MNWPAVRFWTVVLLPAAVLMALEMVSSRILAPHFGNSVYVWGSIIGVFLAAMSVGYSWGGRLADRRPELPMLGRLLLCAAGLQLLVMVVGSRVVAAFGDWTQGSPTGTLLATLVLFAPITVFLSCVAPFAIKLATQDLSLLGGTSGQLYAVSTGGSLVGTLGATFFLIPRLALDNILTLLLLGTLVPCLAALSADAKRQRTWIALAGLLVVLAFMQPNWRDADALEPLANRLTAYQSLQVYDQNGIRYLVSDGTRQSAVDMATGEPALQYARHTTSALLFSEVPRNMLVLGMGAGNVGNFLHRYFPDLQVDYVEIDPAVAELAEEYMGFVPNEMNRVHVDDGRRFLENNDGTWDYILLDTYIGSSVPFHLTTVEFFQLVQRRLAPGGVLAVNMLHGLESPFSAAVARSVNNNFPYLALFSVRGSSNHLLLAKNEPMPFQSEALRARAAELDAVHGFDPSLKQIFRWQLPFDLDLTQAQLLSDRYAPVNHLLHLDRKTMGSLSAGSNEDPRNEPPIDEPPTHEPPTDAAPDAADAPEP